MPWKGVTVSEQREGFTEDYQLTIAPSHSYPKDSAFPPSLLGRYLSKR
jgi:hypothetical protein